MSGSSTYGLSLHLPLFVFDDAYHEIGFSSSMHQLQQEMLNRELWKSSGRKMKNKQYFSENFQVLYEEVDVQFDSKLPA